MFESWIKILDPDQQKINVDPQPCFLEIIFSQKSLFACRADPDGWSLCDAGHPGGAQHHDAAVHQEVEHGYPPGHHPHLGHTQPTYRRMTIQNGSRSFGGDEYRRATPTTVPHTTRPYAGYIYSIYIHLHV